MSRYNRSTVAGILVTIAVFLQWFLQALIIKSLGILLVPIRDEFEADTWALGTSFEFVECINDFLAPFAGAIGTTFSVRPAVITGGIMITAGFIGASRSTNVVPLGLILNILVGVGYSFPHVLARAILGQHFDNRQFSLASGIAKTGTAFSFLLLPPVVQLFLDEYGWRGALLLVGAMCANFIVCGALLLPVSSCHDDCLQRDYKPLPTAGSQMEEHKSGIVKLTCLNIAKRFDTSLMRAWKFGVIILFFVTGRISKSAWIIYFVPHAIAKGFSNQTAAGMATAAGVGHLFGTIIISVAVYSEKVSTYVAFVVSVILIGVSFIIEPWLDSTWLVSANAVLFMAATGSMWALIDVILKMEFGAERMANAYGWIGLFSGVFRLTAGFLPGWIYDQTGSYDLAFIILGVVQMTALVPFLFKGCQYTSW